MANGEQRQRRYFPELDGLRFVAAFLVIVHHLPLELKPERHIHEFIRIIGEFGWVGVDIFLVLSSYLIFTLLLAERRINGDISLRDFYIRRSLRIFPLYFLNILLAFFVFPPLLYPEGPIRAAISQHLFPMLTFTGNLSYMVFTESRLPFFAHLWTISVEEQFYVLAPLLALFASYFRRNAWLIAAAVLLLSFAMRFYVLANGIPYPAVWVFTLCRLDPFVVGAVCAAILHMRPTLRTLPIGWVFSILAVAGFSFVAQFPNIYQSRHASWQLTVVALSAGFLLLGAVLPRGLQAMLTFPGIPYLGKISFGIYVYHYVVIWCVSKYLYVSPSGSLTQFILQLSVVTLVTVAIALVSYLMWERPFLRMKLRFERVSSRPP